MHPRRRLLLAAAAGTLVPASRGAGTTAAAFSYAPVLPQPLAFPGDFGAHPQHRIEWWYLTGQLDPPDAGRLPELGIQVTFFRLRPPIAPENPSAFAAHQLILAHAAIADPRRGSLLFDERMARTGFGRAAADEGDTRVHVDDWRLQRDPATGSYRAMVTAAAFSLSIEARPTQALMLQGERGYSRKQAPGLAPGTEAASHYYSEPQLDLHATVAVAGDGVPAGADAAPPRRGRGWLDHEWSSGLLPATAGGWDWGGFNLDDGGSLTFFRIRPRVASGDTVGYAYAALRAAGGAVRVYTGAQVQGFARRLWTSPRSRASYPIEQVLIVGGRCFAIEPNFDDQEFDARAGSGTIYWEGACGLLEGGRPAGRGYLELTGYAGPALV